MFIRHQVYSRFVLACAVALAACGPAMAQTVAVSARMLATDEVPANSSTGMGMLDGQLDKATRTLKWSVEYAGLTGPVTAGHIHGPAEAGKNAGVALPFGAQLDSPITGSATLTEAQMADLLAGKWYANLHTAAYGGGEVRGQLMVAP